MGAYLLLQKASVGVTWQAPRQRGPDVPQLCSVSCLSGFCLFTSAARFSAGQSVFWCFLR